MSVRLCAVVVALVAIGPAASAPASVHLREFTFVDHSRLAHFNNGRSEPRRLLTFVRYPPGAGPFPLLVFAHGFALTPAPYSALLDYWARAGYVVAAPVFPVEQENAPGGPSESDLGHEPRDISFVITQVEEKLRRLVDPTKVAVAGQSDGAVAALSVAYDKRFADPRVDAALVLSGAAFPGFALPPRRVPPLLAVQGSADPINPPVDTTTYFRLMRRPKFLVWLLGASHLPPYTTHDQWAPTVERTTTAFLDHYLRGAPLRALITAGSRPGIASITSEP